MLVRGGVLLADVSFREPLVEFVLETATTSDVVRLVALSPSTRYVGSTLAGPRAPQQHVQASIRYRTRLMIPIGLPHNPVQVSSQ